ncbi:2-hydroxyacid dehydrogenase [Comamonas humi]
MTRPHLLALVPLPAVTRQALAMHYELLAAADGPAVVQADLPLDQVVAVVTNGTVGLSAALMARLPALRLACAFGVGYENVDVEAARQRGIVVTNAPGTNDDTVADHALGFMLALSRGYGALTEAVRAGGWHQSRAARPTLSGAAVGIIGMGRIGQGIARRAQGFGMRVRYCTRRPCADLPYSHEPDLVALARASDYLVAACPGGPATRHLVNAEVLSALGPQGFLVNVARGSVVQTDDLVRALQGRAIAGAGLDVLESEPEVPEALRLLDNVLITPHMAGRSPAAHQAQTEALLRSLADGLGGRRPAFAVS